MLWVQIPIFGVYLLIPMKKHLLIFVSTILACLNVNGQITAKSTVEAATVYLNGAELTSTVKVSIPSAGQHMVIIENLASSADANTVQALTNSSAVTILSATFSINHLKAKDANPEYRRIKDSLEILKNELSRTVNMKLSYSEEHNMILSNKVVSGQNTGLSVAELQKNADFFRTRLLQVKNEITTLEQKEVKINERLTKYRQQITRFDNLNSQPLGELRLLVETSAPSSPSFRVTYFMPNAGWSPVYDIRVKDINQQPVLSYKAEVQQSSGIDWKNIKLTISSANPSIGGNKPELYPWYLSLVTPYVNRKTKTMNLEYMQAPSEAGAAKSEMQADNDKFYAPAPTVNVTEGQMSVLFDISQSYDIPSDGQQHLVNLRESTLKATYKYFTVPKIDKDAFLMARVTDWEGLQLMPGNANVFFENAYIGQSWLDPGSTEDTLELSLGRDRKIVVERKVIKDYERVKTIGSNKKQTSAYEITVKNTKSTPVEIIIADQVPISKQSEIEVEHEELSGGTLNKETGEVRWTASLAPSESRKYKFVFSVKYPKGKKINM